MTNLRAKLEIERFEKAINGNAADRVIDIAAYLISGDHKLEHLLTVDLCWILGFALRRIKEIDKLEQG